MSGLSGLTHSFARMMGTFCGVIWDTRTDWSDVLAMKGAREVLEGVKYPDDATRRSLYASWLRVLASDVWQDSFDHLMLECVAATPSPSNPEKPLYADIFKAHDPIDRHFPDVVTPVLNPEKRPRLFSGKRRAVEPLPSLPGFVDFVADLLRKSQDSRAALDEAGLIIGFCSLALATVVAKPADLREFLQTRLKSALAAAVPTSFEGDVHCPSERFLSQLTQKAHFITSQVKPFIVLLVLGQYCFHAGAKDAAPSADMKFLEQGFLEPAKFGQLAIVELLYKAEEETGIPAAVLNRKLCAEYFPRSPEVTITSQRVEAFLKGGEEPKQRTRPWCRAANRHFFMYLNLDMNLPYAIRLTAMVASDPDHQLWQRPEYARVPAYEKDRVQRWATNFKRDYRRERVVEESAKRDTNRGRHDIV
ncbi:uncharacterized protein LOC119401388 [Rhipicephalus sanguineus]|uniref:Uncharacterized protein n=1 Tax=Rhipicephalus sanguineus TaxID=34632 RepID=A0A9D4PGQ2_RHISA|nr:uncharacterized protein LOC119401388 [Rhipicephalus sanguineus]KAH7940198.1 hypothetical protein HPB52_022113 [Rhipicephalus sanguineus]